MIYLLATNNPNKAYEIRPMFEAAGLKLITLADLGLNFEANEDGNTFAHNARQKAAETAAFLKDKGKSHDTAKNSNPLWEFLLPFNIAVLADDSGLAVDALDGMPGVDSALFMGRGTPYPEKCQGILDMLNSVPDDKRTARFICRLACIRPGGSLLMTEGIIEGYIAHTISGKGGFGYDPIFYYPPYGKTLAELTSDEKNNISHRGQAIQKMIGLIANASSGT